MDIVPAYSSIAFCFNLFVIHKNVETKTTVFDWVKQQIENQLPFIKIADDAAIETIEIPVCYDAFLNNDLVDITKVTGLSDAEIIQLHSSRNYYVYMLGFLPGFAYMGEVDERIALPRKPNPVKVTAGSIAVAGKQTGIYPLDSFGGWNVLGHTPVKMFNQFDTEPCFLKAGQEVKFSPITLKEYRQLLNAKP